MERWYRAALLSESELEKKALENEPEAEMRERIELRSRCLLTNYLTASAQGRMVDGAEEELQQAAGASQIPIELFDVPEPQRETRADVTTGATATGTGVNLQSWSEADRPDQEGAGR
ncbi:MAG: hypothetical protein OXU26_17985 [Acidobacteriota bacterium]|nr:hypothetical protein [Acidobacteriota bacterium]